MPTYRIRQNQWGNWYGYKGTKRVEAFGNSPEFTAEQAAQSWLRTMQAAGVDLRKSFAARATVKGGTVYLKANVVQVWWDNGAAETWTVEDTPHGHQQSFENFNSMVERWNE